MHKKLFALLVFNLGTQMSFCQYATSNKVASTLSSREKILHAKNDNADLKNAYKVAEMSLIKLKFRDTILTNYMNYHMALDFVFNTKKPYSSFTGVDPKHQPYVIKEYPMRMLFENAGDTSSLNILLWGQKSNYSLIVDANWDKDFSNDKVFSKSMVDSGFTIYDRASPTSEQRTVRVYPFDETHKKGSAEEQKWQMTISSWPLHKYVVLESGLAKQNLLFTKVSPYSKWEKKSTIAFNESYEYKENNHFYTATDSIYFSKNVFVIDSVFNNGDSIFLSKTERMGACGNQIGDSVCYFSETFTREKIQLQLPRSDEKLTILHFWGSWCPPCIAELPGLQKLISSYSNYGEVVNVAYETAQTDLSLNKLLIKFPLKNNVIERSGSSPLTNRFGISEFPSYVIISPEGFYIKKIAGAEGLAALSGLLEEYKKSLKK